ARRGRDRSGQTVREAGVADQARRVHAAGDGSEPAAGGGERKDADRARGPDRSGAGAGDRGAGRSDAGGPTALLKLQADNAGADGRRDSIARRGDTAKKSLDRAQNALDNARQGDDPAAVARLSRLVDRWTGNIEALRAEYRSATQQLNELAGQIRHAGHDPGAINTRAAQQAEQAAEKARSWQRDPASKAQRELLAELLEERGLDYEVPADIAKGNASTLIRSLLDGKDPNMPAPRPADAEPDLNTDAVPAGEAGEADSAALLGATEQTETEPTGLTVEQITDEIIAAARQDET